MQPQILTKPALVVVGMLIQTKPMAPEIPNLWWQFEPRMGEVQHVAEPGVSYGLMGRFDPSTKLSIYIPIEKATD